MFLILFEKRGEVEGSSNEFDKVENAYCIYFNNQILNRNVVWFTFHADIYSGVIIDNRIQKKGKIFKLNISECFQQTNILIYLGVIPSYIHSFTFIPVETNEGRDMKSLKVRLLKKYEHTYPFLMSA